MEEENGGKRNNAALDVPYQNKDLMMKILADSLHGKCFSVFGVDLPEIERVLPTEFPAVTVDDRLADYCILLTDGSVVVVDFESAYKRKKKHSYIDYMNRASQWIHEKYGKYLRMRLLVVYTGDVLRGSTENVLDVGALRLEAEEAFLSDMDGDGVWEVLKQKIMNGEALSDGEKMQVMVFPMSYRSSDERKGKITEVLDVLDTLERDDPSRLQMLSGLLVFGNKEIDSRTEERIWRMVKMTKIGRRIEEEKLEYARIQVDKMKAEMNAFWQEKEAGWQKKEASWQKKEASLLEEKAELLRKLAEMQKSGGAVTA